MVCEKCEKKLGRVITPDTWKDGARNTTESGGRKLNENKALTSKKARFDPYGKTGFATCRICKSSVHQSGSHYCQGCAYKKGICAMCGKKVLDTKNYKQTSVWSHPPGWRISQDEGEAVLLVMSILMSDSPDAHFELGVGELTSVCSRVHYSLDL